MTKKTLAGIHVALLTGFDDQGGFDEKRQANITDYAVRQDVDGLYVGGSSAEAALMSPGELAAQLDVVAPLAAGKTLIAHVGQSNTRDSVMLARRARAAGYHGISALPPSSFPYSVDEVAAHYQAIVEAAGLPLIIYEVPFRTGKVTPLEQLARLLEIPGVAGMKYTSPDLFLLGRLQKEMPDKTFFFGLDEMFGAAAALGIDGGIGTTYNVIGGLYNALFRAIDREDLVTARRLQRVSQDLVGHIFKVNIIPGVKHLMHLAGVDCGTTRLPLSLGPQGAVKAMEEWFAEGHIDAFLAPN